MKVRIIETDWQPTNILHGYEAFNKDGTSINRKKDL